jgi:hypothetical protein
MTVRISMLILCGCTLLLQVAAGLSAATEPGRGFPGPGGNPADIDREILWLDNPDFDRGVESSEVIGVFDLWSEMANDFTLETDAAVRKVTWWGTYWNDYVGVPTGSGFNLRFYMDAGCVPEDVPLLEHLLPGNVCCEAFAEGGDQFSQFVYEYCLDLPLPAGLYWFSAQMADHEFPPQWGRQSADQMRVCDSMWRSPYFSYPEWTPPWLFYEASQMFEDECGATPIRNAGWGTVKGLYK